MRTIFVGHTTKIAHELKTDKGILQLKKKRKRNDHERKHRIQGSEGKYSYHISETQASSGSLPYNNHVIEQFDQMRSELRCNVNKHNKFY